MLDPFSRATIVTMSILCVAGAVAFAPVRARSSTDPIVQQNGAVATATTAADLPETEIRRDPFAGEPSTSERTAPPAASLPPAASVPPRAQPLGDIGPLPANLGSGTIPAIPLDPSTTAVGVTAIVTGAHPYAMVNVAGNHEIKGVGDRVAGKPIVAIDISGVTLQGGQRLTVATGEATR